MDDVPPHIGGHESMTQMDEGAFDYLVSRFNVKNMADIGCGPGGMVRYALTKGIRAVGIDGDPTVARNCSVIIEHDYTKKPLYLGEFDLGWSVEFVEHVEAQYIPNFMETFRSCKHVFITAAVPGQPGYHHVNCQWPTYWIARFKEAGFELDEEATRGVKEHSTMGSRFTERTGLVFTRKSSGDRPIAVARQPRGESVYIHLVIPHRPGLSGMSLLLGTGPVPDSALTGVRMRETAARANADSVLW